MVALFVDRGFVFAISQLSRALSTDDACRRPFPCMKR